VIVVVWVPARVCTPSDVVLVDVSGNVVVDDTVAVLWPSTTPSCTR
jgi:hypothetical protein